jgi:hypothetical protein
MAITITQGDMLHNTGWQSVETFTESTATAQRFLDAQTDVSFLGMGTATAGPVHNQYALTATTTASGREGDAIEGFEKYVMATATGRADLFVALPTQGRLPLQAMLQIDAAATGDIDQTMASATGTWVFQSDGDYLHLKFMNGTWNYLGGAGATMAAAT